MKTKFILNKVAAALAFVIGVMAIFAGGKVLMGVLPDYYVIDWLPIYNFTVGIVSASFSAIVLWKNSKLAMPTVVATLGLHTVVMLILQTAYHSVVAPDSIKAMTVRLIVWTIILILMIVQHFALRRTSIPGLSRL